MYRRTLLATAGPALVFSRADEAEANGWLIGIFLACLAGYVIDELVFHGNIGRWLTRKAEETNQTLFQPEEERRRHEQAVNSIMSQLGYSFDLSAKIVETAGMERVPDILTGKLGVWCQTDTTGRNFNKIFARIQNKSENEMAGQIKYMISDMRTGKGELQIDSDGYRLNGLGVMDTETSIAMSLPSPGWKRISVIGQPPWVKTSTSNVLIMPDKAVAS